MEPADSAQNELGEVRLCGCGGVNLTMGALTLHLAAEEVTELGELMGAAMQLIEQAQPLVESGDVDEKSKAQGDLH